MSQAMSGNTIEWICAGISIVSAIGSVILMVMTWLHL